MACFYPLQAFQLESGEVVFAERGRIKRPLTLPCGQCVGCRLERSRQWAIRCVHEAQCHEFNVFVTLTYDDDNVPAQGVLFYRHFQLFMKRLRRVRPGVRFFMCGEYGETTSRPHYHACLFNCFFADRVVHSSLASGFKLYTSAVLSDLWPHGFASIGDVTFESAAYVARYVMKKVTGNAAKAHYERADLSSGEIYSLPSEFTRMSLKPGIGADWFLKFRKEVQVRDGVVLRGMVMKPPRFYDKLLERVDPFAKELQEYTRYVKAADFVGDSSPSRLAVREHVTKARLRFKLRTLE